MRKKIILFLYNIVLIMLLFTYSSLNTMNCYFDEDEEVGIEDISKEYLEIIGPAIQSESDSYELKNTCNREKIDTSVPDQIIPNYSLPEAIDGYSYSIFEKEDSKERKEVEDKKTLKNNNLEEKCIVCKKNLLLGNVKGHIKRKHPEVKTFSCEKCDKIFLSKKGLNIHNSKIHPTYIEQEGNKLNEAFSFNRKTIKNYTDSEVNYEVKKYIGSYTNCLICNKKFNDTSAVRLHIKTIHLGQYHQCPYCKKQCTQQRHLKSHIINNHSNKTINCKLCHEKILQDLLKKHHIEKHSTIKYYLCEFCPNKLYLSKQGLQYHINQDHG